MECTSRIIVTSDILSAVETIRQACRDAEIFEILRIEEKESFKVEDAKLATQKAYIALNKKKVIVLAAQTFSVVVQNKLLKILEEPPPNTEFVLVTASKSAILPTVRSRLPLIVSKQTQDEDNGEDFDTIVVNLNLQEVYRLAQQYKRSDAQTMKKTIERMVCAALNSKRYDIDESLLDLMHDAIKALDSGTPPAFVLNALLLKLLAKRKR